MKKILIILISILLLSSPVFGDNHKGETLYGWGEYPVDYVWKRVGEKGTHSVYKGEVENGKPNGIGILTFTNGWKYVGSWKDGIRNGQGTLTSQDAFTVYVGEWKNGKKHGQGTFTSPDGRKYVGGWKDSKPHGQGTFSSTGETPGLTAGEYVGEWKNGLQNGQGTFTWYSQGKKDEGIKYVGEWKDGKEHGQGTRTYPWGKRKFNSDEGKYVGEWKNGKEHGQGTFTWLDGEKYVGEKYVGEWKDGMKHGKGTKTYSNGMKYVGSWRKERVWNGKLYDKNGNITGKYVMREWIEQ